MDVEYALKEIEEIVNHIKGLNDELDMLDFAQRRSRLKALWKTGGLPDELLEEIIDETEEESEA